MPGTSSSDIVIFTVVEFHGASCDSLWNADEVFLDWPTLCNADVECCCSDRSEWSVALLVERSVVFCRCVASNVAMRFATIRVAFETVPVLTLDSFPGTTIVSFFDNARGSSQLSDAVRFATKLELVVAGVECVELDAGDAPGTVLFATI